MAAALCGFVLDLLLADPPAFPHPVVWMGRAIRVLERFLRHALSADTVQPARRWRSAGGYAAGGTLALSGAVFLGSAHPSGAGFAVQVLWSWQALAVRGLAQESRRVYEQLRRGDFAARRAVGRIVGGTLKGWTKPGIRPP